MESRASTFLVVALVVTGAAAPLQAKAAKIVRVTSSSAQNGNEAGKALDGSTSSRWAVDGKGQWLQLEFDRAVTFARVDLGFQRGRPRKYGFVLAVSNDGKKWKTVFNGKSSGRTEKAESHTFASATGKFLRYTNQGNNENSWVSLHTLRIPGVGAQAAAVIAKAGGKKSGGGGGGASKLLAHYTFDGEGRALLNDRLGGTPLEFQGEGRPKTIQANVSKNPELKKGNCVRLLPANKQTFVMPAALTAGRKTFSFSWWVYLANIGKGGTLLSNRNAPSGSGDFGVTSKNGLVGYWSGLGAGDQTVDSDRHRLAAKAWNHLVLTCDGKALFLYLNGEVVNPSGLPVTQGLNDLGVYFGSAGNYEPALDQAFHPGYYDDLRIYGSILTAGQVRMILLGREPFATTPEVPTKPILSPAQQLLALDRKLNLDEMLVVINEKLASADSTKPTLIDANPAAQANAPTGVPRASVEGKRFKMPSSGLVFMVAPALRNNSVEDSGGGTRVKNKKSKVQLRRTPEIAVDMSVSSLRYLVKNRIQAIQKEGSVFCWIRVADLKLGGTIFCRGQRSEYYNYNDIVFSVSPDGFHVRLNNGDAGSMKASSENRVPANEWVLLGFTWNAAEVKMYINGAMDSTHKGGQPGIRGSFIELGSMVSGPAASREPYRGLFGAAFFYKRAISASEVIHLYGATAKRFSDN